MRQAKNIENYNLQKNDEKNYTLFVHATTECLFRYAFKLFAHNFADCPPRDFAL